MMRTYSTRRPPLYNSALKASGYSEQIKYMNNENTGRKKRNRRRNIIWFNPPFSKSVQSNIGRTFLRIIKKHFPPSSKLHQIFNSHCLKLSYSCMENVGSLVKSHNKKVAAHQPGTPEDLCNCRTKAKCPLGGCCQTRSIVYNAKVTSENGTSAKYIGLTENAFKTRYSNHIQSFTHKKYENSTELSKYIWNLKCKNQPSEISWSILSHAQAYTNATKRCNLCLTEKLCIMNADKSSLLNSRSELISKCRHENKYYLSNFRVPHHEWNDPRKRRRFSARSDDSGTLKDKFEHKVS